MAAFRCFFVADTPANVIIGPVQRPRTDTLKCEGASNQKRSICPPRPKKSAASGCSFDDLFQRANAETMVMRRILTHPFEPVGK
jgi:hypothetical protein